MNKFSVIILAKNVESTLQQTLLSAKKISNDIIVADSGSTDNTLKIADEQNVRVFKTEWKGFGPTRNAAAAIAENDWVFCLDADEVITGELAKTVLNSSLSNNIIYGCKRINFLGGKKIKYGEWGKDTVYRVYNKKYSSWNNDDVHEMVVSNDITVREKFGGEMLHYTIDSIALLKEKTERYARLSAKKYFSQGKKANFFKLHFSPAFNFINNYIFRLGFLDGREGYELAKVLANYTKDKYLYLSELNKGVAS